MTEDEFLKSLPWVGPLGNLEWFSGMGLMLHTPTLVPPSAKVLIQVRLGSQDFSPGTGTRYRGIAVTIRCGKDTDYNTFSFAYLASEVEGPITVERPDENDCSWSSVPTPESLKTYIQMIEHWAALLLEYHSGNSSKSFGNLCLDGLR